MIACTMHIHTASGHTTTLDQFMYDDLAHAIADAQQLARQIIDEEDRNEIPHEPHRVIFITNEGDVVLAAVPFLNS